jgi:ribosome biogenesis GTPase
MTTDSGDLATLAGFGWSHHFQSQLGETDTGIPARVGAVHRDGLEIIAPGVTMRVHQLAADDEEARATVGDWLLVDTASGRVVRLLARRSVFKRRAAGTGRRVQLIAANVDTLFVVTSCNADFNIARLERFLALAREALVTPVVVLTKADLSDDTAAYESAARRLMPGLFVACLDARDAASVAVLAPWCGPGQTVALVGSSGTGKSTLVNTLAGVAQATAGIREDDARGRHTTTGRSLHRLAAGGWLLDTPGMRELQLADAQDGIADVFADVVALAAGCRFADCGHDAEPGCAVRAAIVDGTLDADRLERYRKLAREDVRNSEAIHQRRARQRRFGRVARAAMQEKKDRRGD